MLVYETVSSASEEDEGSANDAFEASASEKELEEVPPDSVPEAGVK
jgi:hypothetical protein